MKFKLYLKISVLLFAILILNYDNGTLAQASLTNSELDKKVEQFLEKHEYRWLDMNIPTKDGKLLYDLILKNNYKSAVEIGTSTGHSAIWIAWALSKTGGKLVTIEINESRLQKALANFKEAGLDKYIDARLADAHKLVPRLKGPIDFVFCDADKGWYKNYFKALRNKIVPGGCFAAHNITFGSDEKVVTDFLKYAENLQGFRTSIENQSSSGISVSYKTEEK